MQFSNVEIATVKPDARPAVWAKDVEEPDIFGCGVQLANDTRLATKMRALTFVRTSELIGARWSEFDIEARRWNIPAERMKMKTPHIVPLATQTIELLELLRSVTGGSELLFPGDIDHHKQMSNNTILFALKRMG